MAADRDAAGTDPPDEQHINLTGVTTLGELVNAVTRYLGITKTEFARRVGINRNSLYPIVRCEVSPSPRVIRGIVSAIAAESIYGLDEATINDNLGYVTSSLIHPQRFDHDELGLYLVAIRQHLGWTQEELGERIGVLGTSISAYELGSQSPTIGTVASLYRHVLLCEEIIGETNYYSLTDLIGNFYPGHPAGKTLAQCDYFGQMIRVARELASMSGLQLADDVGVSENHIKNIEAAKVHASNSVATRLVHALTEQFGEDFTRDDALEKHGYVTKRSLHPANWAETDIGDWMCAARLFAELEQSDVGSLVGRKAGTIGAYERGAKAPPFEVITALYRTGVAPHLRADDPEYFSLMDVQLAFTAVTPGQKIRTLMGAPGAALLAQTLPTVLRAVQTYGAPEASDPDTAIVGLIRTIRRRSDGPADETSSDAITHSVMLELLQDPSPHLPVDVEHQVLARITQIRRELHTSLGREPSDIELAQQIAPPVDPATGALPTPAGDGPQQTLLHHRGRVPPVGGVTPRGRQPPGPRRRR